MKKDLKCQRPTAPVITARLCKSWGGRIALLFRQGDLYFEDGEEVPIAAIDSWQEVSLPEVECEDERIRKRLIECLKLSLKGAIEQDAAGCSREKDIEAYKWGIACLEKQGGQKELNLVETLKHYPRETELYSPLYGKLWLAEVDEEHGIITCYKYQLENKCTRAVLEQEDTVSFYSNGTTGLPDFSVSKDCMLFLYDSKKQKEQKPVEWSEEDEYVIDKIVKWAKIVNPTSTIFEKMPKEQFIKRLKSLKYRFNGQSQLTELEEKVKDIILCSIQNSQIIDENTWAKKWAKDLLELAREELEKETDRT